MFFFNIVFYYYFRVRRYYKYNFENLNSKRYIFVDGKVIVDGLGMVISIIKVY